MQLIICQSQGVKINGRKPTMNDFLPDYAKPKRKANPKNQEQAIQAGLASLALKPKKTA